jgi:hypothetical protein
MLELNWVQNLRQKQYPSGRMEEAEAEEAGYRKRLE